jgi:glycosyltransferase involved in cell wall biosynthesis
MPRLSVLLPVRDAAPWLAASLASLACQTLRDHEVIAVDDGSTDGSGEILERVARTDARLVVHHTPPRGLPAALNLALSQARAGWVARHDADDRSHPERFARQLAWVERHPETDVLGTGLRLFPGGAVGAGMRRWVAWHNALLDHEAMRRELLIDSPLAHGTAFLRRSALENVGGWHERGWAEDLDLWVRLYGSGARFAKLQDTLYDWRQHPGSSTRVDERYSHERFLSLKVSALSCGFLRDRGPVTLLGVGRSLARWRQALGERVRDCLEMRRPWPESAPAPPPPMILAYMAPAARARWRAHLQRLDMRELSDFIFVA